MKKTMAGICALTLAMLACNLLNNELTRPPQSQSAIATVVAETMQAVQTTSLTTPVVEDLGTPTSNPPSPTAAPMVVVKSAVSCRSGPAQTYKNVSDLKPDQSEPVLGKDPSGQYWLIQISSGTCWVEAQSVEIKGSTQNVPELTPPPVSAGGVPTQPGNLFYNYSCTSLTQASITLTWRDVADNETGYRVYRNGSSIADLPANSTEFTDNTTRGSGSVFSYSVEAYNDVGASARRSTGDFRLSNCSNP
jgi:hypothetical protein